MRPNHKWSCTEVSLLFNYFKREIETWFSIGLAKAWSRRWTHTIKIKHWKSHGWSVGKDFTRNLLSWNSWLIFISVIDIAFWWSFLFNSHWWSKRLLVGIFLL